MRALLIVMLIWVCASVQADDQPPLIGEVSAQAILSLPAFERHYAQSEPVLLDEELRAFLTGAELVVLFGTWCHDSEREVPRLMRVLEQGDFSVRYIAISRDKSEPMVAVERHQLQFTPTLVVYHNGVEAGRIIETPEHTWLEDLRALSVNQTNAQ
ncbi:thioredoxin family protein [Simiduia agarivorans]|uniref:Thioredoxin family protein n=1 Tax=Simiduia agarivorans (strain DSM 21679 / JCM 13881 / BCRC 17597 / SA1) TaxID=1117647 RepID=K4KZX2_SIMAS|nr:thioredoxin family protein [Simiduia agarivorans]AFU99477.1 putative thioredoxin family protein [Simiduia agarivorans SA1 = DSM 21679]